MYEQQDTFDDLASFNQDYKAEQPTYNRLKVENLADGPYDCEILTAELKRAGQGGQRILELGLRAGDVQVDHTYWLDKQDKMNALGADMAVLGFPSDRWGRAGGEPIERALPAAVSRLPGIKFRAMKSSKAGEGQNVGKTFHKLHINALLSGKPMPGTNGAQASRPNGPAAPAGPPSGPRTDTRRFNIWDFTKNVPVEVSASQVQQMCDETGDTFKVYCLLTTEADQSKWRTAADYQFSTRPKAAAAAGVPF